MPNEFDPYNRFDRTLTYDRRTQAHTALAQRRAGKQPSVDVAPITSASVTYLQFPIQVCFFSMHVAETGFPSFTLSLSAEGNKPFLFLWTWTSTCDPDWLTWSRQGQGKPKTPPGICRSKVIINCSTWTTNKAVGNNVCCLSSADALKQGYFA